VLVSNIEAACEFFVGKLGFEVVFSYGEPPFYAQVGRDAALLNLRLVRTPAYVADLQTRERDVLCAVVTVEGIEALCVAYEAVGVPLHQPLRREAWGSRTFIVAGPDGNLIGFAGQ
jgi:catechol 2,3-dioxygenase-like lactoylglutathione lyase family enzyme